MTRSKVRSKVKLQLIEKESDRRISFQKRKKSLMKLLDELSTLCDVDVCAMIMSPYNSNVEIWPSHSGLLDVLAQFKRMPEKEQTKYMFNQETFTQERINKLSEQWRKLCIENQRMEIDQIINQRIASGNFDNQNNLHLLNDISLVLSRNIQEIDMRIRALKGEKSSQEMPMNGMQIEGTSRSENLPQ